MQNELYDVGALEDQNFFHFTIKLIAM